MGPLTFCPILTTEYQPDVLTTKWKTITNFRRFFEKLKQKTKNKKQNLPLTVSLFYSLGWLLQNSFNDNSGGVDSSALFSHNFEDDYYGILVLTT